MPKRAATSLHDGELLITLPAGFLLVHVDDDKAPWSKGWKGRKVDWAWQEPDGLYFCELKDPECMDADTHPRPVGHKSHVGKVLEELSGIDYANVLAQKACNTLVQLPHANGVASYRYLIVAAISHPDFTSAIAMAAADNVRRHMAQVGTDMPVLVLNIKQWNTHLQPRALTRVP